MSTTKRVGFALAAGLLLAGAAGATDYDRFEKRAKKVGEVDPKPLGREKRLCVCTDPNHALFRGVGAVLIVPDSPIQNILIARATCAVRQFILPAETAGPPVSCNIFEQLR